jgi:hypothetical protein
MSTAKLFKLAQKLESKLQADPSVVVTEHEGVEPKAYMAFSNLKNIIADASELLGMMNESDVLPQWADEAIANAKMNVTKIMGYVRSEKTKVTLASGGCTECTECNDVHCCMNYNNTHEMNADTNEAKCIGTKHSPVGSPRQRAFCKRHCGMKKKLTSKEVANDPESCINKGLRRWRCHCK